MSSHILFNCKAFHQCALSCVSSAYLANGKSNHTDYNWSASQAFHHQCALSYVFPKWANLSKNGHIGFAFLWKLSYFVHHRHELQSMSAESWFLKMRYSQMAIWQSGPFLLTANHCWCILEHCYECSLNLCQSPHSKNVEQGCWKAHVWNLHMKPKLPCWTSGRHMTWMFEQ